MVVNIDAIYFSIFLTVLAFFEGMILLITKNEEWSFWLLKVVLDNIVGSYHTKTMDGLKRDTGVLRELLIQRVPAVNKRLEDFGEYKFCFINKFEIKVRNKIYLGLPIVVISTKWLICLFAEVLPTETVLRIWDCIFLEGYKVCACIVAHVLLCSNSFVSF